MKKVLTFVRMDSFNIANLVAVELTLGSTICDPLTLLKRAVTDWVENTDEGREAWEDSCEDFNIGDLLSVSDNESLSHTLAKHGINGIETLYTLCDEDIVPYDRVLADVEDEDD